jgi:methylated-DNA-protein-cysteine methyltransferase related protein
MHSAVADQPGGVATVQAPVEPKGDMAIGLHRHSGLLPPTVTNAPGASQNSHFPSSFPDERLRAHRGDPYHIRARTRVPPLRLVLHPPEAGTGPMTTMTPVPRETLVGNALALKANYTRMHDDILRVVRAIPAGRVTTVGAISQYLQVPAHHVSFLLARRFECGDESVPWYRVLSHRGAVGRPLFDADGRSQAECLAADGVVVGFRGRIADFTARFYAPGTEGAGLTAMVR